MKYAGTSFRVSELPPRCTVGQNQWPEVPDSDNVCMPEIPVQPSPWGSPAVVFGVVPPVVPWEPGPPVDYAPLRACEPFEVPEGFVFVGWDVCDWGPYSYLLEAERKKGGPTGWPFAYTPWRLLAERSDAERLLEWAVEHYRSHLPLWIFAIAVDAVSAARFLEMRR